MKAPGSSDSVDVALLDTGPYPTHATHPFGKADTPENGAYLEAVRMAEFVTGPWEVDATLRKQALPNGSLSTLKTLKAQIGDEPSQAAAAHSFITAFVSSRNLMGPGEAKGLSNMVMRFPDADAAAAAAKEMGAAELRMESSVTTPHVPVTIPRHPEAFAASFENKVWGHVVASYAAHGPYVLYQFANTKDRPEIDDQLVATALDIQASRIDDFQPTDPDKLADLPVDPTGQLLARTMPPTQGENPLPTAGVYQPGAELHFEYDPAEAGQLFTAAGVEVVTQRWRTRVYQAHDATGAARVVNRFVLDTAAKPMPGINGLPDAKCFDQGENIGPLRFACLAAVERYAYIAMAGQEAQAKQIASAQYRILAGK
ncbi:hypothetical protein BST20_17885 [Mycobacterium branderi]|nr:hypothetical protein BST20_17885 [Mycobacterium branderi]